MALARHYEQPVTAFARLLDGDVGALTTEIAAFRYAWALEAANAVRMLPTKEQGKRIERLRTSLDDDERLAWAILDRRAKAEREQAEQRKQAVAAGRQARLRKRGAA